MAIRTGQLRELAEAVSTTASMGVAYLASVNVLALEAGQRADATITGEAK